MSEKKSYSVPTLYRVDLDHEQAILSACSLTTNSVIANSTRGCRPSGVCEPPGTPGGCKRSRFWKAKCRDSGPRPS